MTSRFWRLAIVGTAALLFFPLCYVAAAYAPVPRSYRSLIALAFGALLAFVLSAFVRRIFKWNNSSPGVHVFFTHRNAEKIVIVSHVESMIAAGYHAKAEREIESLITTHGLDAKLCRIAVDFHLGKHGSGDRAESLLRRMRSEQPLAFELYATQRLVDLYMRKDDTRGKALTELRRIVARFPATVDAKGAIACIEQLRAIAPANSDAGSPSPEITA